MAESFNSFAKRAMFDVERDAPACAAAIAKALGDTRIVAHVGGETAVFWCEGDRPMVDDLDAGEVSPDERTALLETSSRHLVDVLAGRSTLLGAVESNDLRVRAPATAAARLFDTMRAFVEGVARSADATSLYEDFRRGVDDR